MLLDRFLCIRVCMPVSGWVLLQGVYPCGITDSLYLIQTHTHTHNHIPCAHTHRGLWLNSDVFSFELVHTGWIFVLFIVEFFLMDTDSDTYTHKHKIVKDTTKSFCLCRAGVFPCIAMHLFSSKAEHLSAWLQFHYLSSAYYLFQCQTTAARCEWSTAVSWASDQNCMCI